MEELRRVEVQKEEEYQGKRNNTTEETRNLQQKLQALDVERAVAFEEGLLYDEKNAMIKEWELKFHAATNAVRQGHQKMEEHLNKEINAKLIQQPIPIPTLIQDIGEGFP